MFPSNPYDQPKDATLELLHDKMNVVAFAAIFAFASSSLNGGWPGHHATASFSLAYLVVDLGLAIFVPAMFKAPGPIILHHVVTIALHLHPVFVEPEHAEYASMALLVELNTLLVTLRRLLDYPPVVEVAFWTSFVLLRLVLYPCIAWGLIEASYYNPVVQSSGMCNAESGCYIPKFISSTPRHGEITPSVKKVAWLFVAITGLQFYTTFVLLRNIWKRRTRPADKAD